MPFAYQNGFLVEVQSIQNTSEIDEVSDRYSEDDLSDALEELHRVWIQDGPGPDEAYKWACERLGCSSELPDPMVDISRRAGDAIVVAGKLYEILHSQGLVNRANAEGLERLQKIQIVLKMMKITHDFLRTGRVMLLTPDPEAPEEVKDDLGINSLMFEDESKLTNFQNLTLYVLKLLEQRGLRKHGDSCYEEITTPSGHSSYAWKLSCRIVSFIYQNVTKELDPKYWKCLTNPTNNSDLVANHLTESTQSEFPLLKFNKMLFSFPNGIFHKRWLIFWPYEQKDQWPQLTESKRQTWLNLGVPCDDLRPPERSDVAIKYFDKPMPWAVIKIINYCNLDTYRLYAPLGTYWVKDENFELEGSHVDATTSALQTILTERAQNGLIELTAAELAAVGDISGQSYARAADGECFIPVMLDTPAADKVLDDQNFENDTKECFYQQCGRLGFDIGHLDNWQVLMFIKGIAGSGKSTFAQVLKCMYPPELIAILSSNAESKFGLAPIADKELCVCPEVKADFAISQGDLQSAVSGEDVSFAEKFKPARSKVWTCPFLFCGNEVANWRDAAGSMKRRLLVFEYEYRVHGGDPHLKEKMLKSMPVLLAKICIAYCQASYKFSDANIWEQKNGVYVLPQQVRTWAEAMRRQVDPLCNFLNSPMVSCDPLKYMTQSRFVELFKTYCRETINAHCPMWTEDFYRDDFAQLNITVQRDELMCNGEMKTDIFIKGVGLPDDS